MSIKLELPGELRAAIEKFLAALDSALKRAPENRAAITDEITNLENDARGLSIEIGQLQSAAVGNEKAASSLNAKEIRLRQVNARLDEQRELLNELRPVTLFGAQSLLVEVTHLYSERLPGAIVCSLAEVCPTFSKAITIAKLSEAYSCLRGIRNWSYAINSEPATPGNVQKLKAILHRALRGQAHLGYDAPAPDAAEAPAPGEQGLPQTEALANASQPEDT